MFELRAMPGLPMAKEEMERQCRLTANAARAIEEAGLNELNWDQHRVMVNTETLEVVVEEVGERGSDLNRHPAT